MLTALLPPQPPPSQPRAPPSGGDTPLLMSATERVHHLISEPGNSLTCILDLIVSETLLSFLLLLLVVSFWRNCLCACALRNRPQKFRGVKHSTLAGHLLVLLRQGRVTLPQLAGLYSLGLDAGAPAAPAGSSAGGEGGQAPAGAAPPPAQRFGWAQSPSPHASECGEVRCMCCRKPCRG